MDVTAPDLIRFLKIRALQQVPVHIEGISGIGKSQIIDQAAHIIDQEYPEPNNPFQLRDVRTITKNPVEMGGLPRIIDDSAEKYGITAWSRPGFLPSTGRGYMFFDEVTQADHDVQKVLMELILERKIGEHRLGDGWSIVTAANTAAAKAATHKMLGPMANRMCHFTLIPDVPAWCDWASRNGVDPMVIAWQRFRIGAGRIAADDKFPAGMLHRFDPNSTDLAWPSPRTIKGASDDIKMCKEKGYSETDEDALIASRIGVAAKDDFRAFANLVKGGFDANKILTDPLNATVVTDPAICQAITGFLARNANRNNFANIVAYAKRMQLEYFAATILMARDFNPIVANTPEYIRITTDPQLQMIFA